MRFIEYLQSRSYQTRTRLMWTASSIAACVVVSLWFLNFRHNVQQLSGADLIDFQTEEIVTNQYLTVESAEIKDNRTYLYFTITNPTADILNFADTQNVILQIDRESISPVAITTRQNQPFVRKVLSNSQNFGILIFDKPLTGKGELSLENLSFEQSSQSIFKEKTSIDFSKLNKPHNIGN